jgi:hypothetical protein
VAIDERDFGRLEGKVDGLHERFKVLERIEERLRDLEESRANYSGRHSMISAGVSVVVAGLTAWATKHFA